MDYSRHSGPLISVIVPVFNEEQSIGRLLQGLHSQLQPLDSFEVVLVDNGSTDGTLNLVREFNLQGKLNIRILHELKRSSCTVRNRVLRNQYRLNTLSLLILFVYLKKNCFATEFNR